MPSRFLRIWLRSRTEIQVLINALTVHVGTGTNMSGLPTYQDLVPLGEVAPG
jgi:hypothetical protein